MLRTRRSLLSLPRERDGRFYDRGYRAVAQDPSLVVNDINGQQRSVPLNSLATPFQFADLQPGESRRSLTDLNLFAIFSQRRFIPLSFLPLLIQLDVSPGSACRSFVRSAVEHRAGRNLGRHDFDRFRGRFEDQPARLERKGVDLPPSIDQLLQDDSSR